MEEAVRKQLRRRKGEQDAEHRKAFNQAILDSLITYELVEQEALNRNYINDPLFKKDVDAYKDQLLINLFKQAIILPRAIPNEKELEEYYETHRDEFKRDDEIWFSEMTFLHPDMAEAALKELKAGADFEFLLSKASLSRARPGVHVWIPLGDLSAAMRKGIKDLDVGGLSDIIKDSRKYKIIKLKGKREGKPEAFSRIIDKVRQVVIQKKFNQWLQKYLKALRNASSIDIHKKMLNKLTERYTEGT
jgi:parvulin-like peptidyl-prolyl isomerase